MPTFNKKRAIAVMKEFVHNTTSAAISLSPEIIANDFVAETSSANRFNNHRNSTTTRGLESWNKAKPEQIVRYLKDQHPQIVAVCLSFFDPHQAANVLAKLPSQDRPDIVKRIAELSAIKPSSIEQLNRVVESSVTSSELSTMTSMGGIKTAADILNLLPTGLDKDILLNVAEESENLANDIEESMFTFEDLIKMEGEYIAKILGEVNSTDVVYALKAADTTLQNKFLGSLSKRMAAKIKDDLESSKPVRIQVVEDSQRNILNKAKAMADDGLVVLPGQGDEMFT